MNQETIIPDISFFWGGALVKLKNGDTLITHVGGSAMTRQKLGMDGKKVLFGFELSHVKKSRLGIICGHPWSKVYFSVEDVITWRDLTEDWFEGVALVR